MDDKWSSIMRKFSKKLIVVLLICAMFIPQVCFAAIYDNGSEYTWDGDYYAAYKQSEKDISIAYTANVCGNYAGGEGGMARALTALKNIRKEYQDSYFLDAGNFTGGEDIFAGDKKDSYPMDILSQSTYDAAALGKNELGNANLKDIIAGAVDNNSASGEKLPKLLASNTKLNSDLTKIEDDKIYTGYKIIKKFNSKIAVFAINDESSKTALEQNKNELKSPEDSAKEVLDKIKDENVNLVVCLYSGEKKDGEDSAKTFAKNVNGIDLIISGTSSSEAKEVNGIVLAGVSDNCKGIGHVVMTKDDSGKFKLSKGTEIKLDNSLKENSNILKTVAKHQEGYFKQFGFNADKRLTTNDVEFTAIDKFGKEQGDDNLGNIISDSYLYADDKKDSDDIKDVCSVVASGAVKNTIPTGDVMPSQVFSMFDKKAGTDNLAGIDLMKVYVTGAELRLLGEIDASLSNEENGLRLYTSGLGYEYNPHRFYLNHVSDYWYQGNKDKEKIDDKELYGLIMDSNTFEILREGNSSPFGLLDIKYKDKNGNAIEDYDKTVIKKDDKNVKAWFAVANYLFDKDVDSSYAKPANHKVLNDSSSLTEIFKNPGKSFMFAACVMIIAFALLVLLVIFVIFVIKKILKVPPKSKYNSLYSKQSKQAPIFKHRRNRYRDKTRRKFK